MCAMMCSCCCLEGSRQREPSASALGAACDPPAPGVQAAPVFRRLALAQPHQKLCRCSLVANMAETKPKTDEFSLEEDDIFEDFEVEGAWPTRVPLPLRHPMW